MGKIPLSSFQNSYPSWPPGERHVFAIGLDKSPLFCEDVFILKRGREKHERRD